jgi:signal transduction histidine kinase/putative methionine-R-sulfoxide reductase with GAF domain
MRDFLGGINQAILGSDEAGELYQKCCQIAVEKGLFKMAWIGLIVPESRVMPVAIYGETGDYLINILITVNEEPTGCGPCGTSIKTNNIIVCNDIANDPTALPWKDMATRNGFDSMIMMPIRLYGKPVGAFGFYSNVSNVFTQDEIGLLREIEEDISLAVTSYDISERRKAAEDELKDSEEKYRSLFDNMREGFAYCEMIYDLEGKPIDWTYLKVNPAFHRLTGLKDIVGKRVNEVIPDIKELNPELFEIYGDVAKTGLPMEFEIEFKPLKLSLKVSAFSPKLDHFVAIFEDFTEYMHKMAEQRLLNKKFELLGQISRHDIMNQMLVINGISEALGKNSDREKLTRSLDSIQNASEKIDRILQFGKEYEEIGIRNPEWIDIFRTISRTSNGFAQVKIEIDISLDGLRVYADPLIERVFFNLFDNAIRHGGKTAEIKVGKSDTPEELIIVVEDDGVGISAEEKATLFQYGQGEGKGFGLYLCREILEMTGLKMNETGIPGRGARFEVHIPKENVFVERNIVFRSYTDC